MSNYEAAGPDLFSEGLVRSYVDDDPRFVERPWLAELVEERLADPRCRFLLLLGEPGAGKTALLAWLARQNPGWPRYFIRRDSQVPLNSGDAQSLLFALGHQLAALRPSLFHPDRLEVVVRQHVGEVAAGGRAVGIRVEDLEVSPFYETALQVEQEATLVIGELAGISVGRVIAEKRFLELQNLQHLALLDPARSLLGEEPAVRLVVLVDALDELRYQAATDSSALGWLATCPELPANVRFVLSSRPDDRLLDLFRRRQGKWLREAAIDADPDEVENDLRRYTRSFAAGPEVADELATNEIPPERFVSEVVRHADGNFQYVASLLRAIEHAVAAVLKAEEGQESERREALRRLLCLEEVPAGLGDLYGFFLSLVREPDERVDVAGATLGERQRVPAWEGLYQPILGVLAVALEPLTADQICRFGAIEVEERWIRSALARLGQFLDREAERYRLYHATFAEYLTAAATQTTAPDDYLNPKEWHRRIAESAVTRYGKDWLECDDHYILDHTPAHLAEAREFNALRRLLVTFEWLQAKLQSAGVASLTADYARLPDDPTLRLIRDAVRLATSPLFRARTDLAGQLIGRLSSSDNSEIQDLLISAMSRAPRPWLRPIHATLATPGGALLRTFSEDEGSINAVAATPDGFHVLTASDDHTLKLWDLSSGELIRTLIGHDHWVLDVALTPDGKCALSGGSGDAPLKLWNIETGEVTRTLREDDRVYAVAIASDGRRAASGTNFGALRIWDLQSGAELWETHTDWIYAMSFSPDGRFLITAGEYGSVGIWDLANGELYQAVEHHRAQVNDVALTRDGRRALSASEDGDVVLWEVPSGTHLQTFKNNGEPVGAVALTPDGRRALSGSGFQDGSIVVWDVFTARRERTLGLNRAPIRALTVLEDGRHVISSSPLRLWDLDAHDALPTLEDHPEEVRAVSIAGDGRQATSCCRRPSVKHWKVDSGDVLLRRDIVAENIMVVSLSSDGRRVLAGSGYGDLAYFDVERNELLAQYPSKGGFVRALAQTGDGRFAAATYRGAFYIWDLLSAEEIFAGDSSPNIGLAVAIGADARFVLLGYDNPTPELWDVQGATLLHKLGEHTLTTTDVEVSYSDWISAVALTPDGRVAATGSPGGSIVLWDSESGEPVRSLDAKSAVECIAITPDAHSVVCGCRDGSVQLWRLGSSQPPASFTADDAIGACEIAPDGRRIIAGDDAGRVHFLEVVE